MREIDVYSLGVPPAFSPPSELYWTERLHYELSYMLYDLQQAGFVITQPESDDLINLENPLNTWASEFSTWLDNATSMGERGVPAVSPPSLPSLVEMLTLAIGSAGGIPGVIISILLRSAINVLTKVAERLLIPDTGDLEELTDLLKQVLIVDPDTPDELTLAQILKTYGLSETPGGSLYSALLDIARQSVNVNLQNTNAIDSMTLE